MRKSLLFLLQIVFLLGGIQLSCSPVFAQQGTAAPPKEITGNITNEKGEPLEGVSVNERGTRNFSVTDTHGDFKLKVSRDKIYAGHIERQLHHEGIIRFSWPNGKDIAPCKFKGAR